MITQSVNEVKSVTLFQASSPTCASEVVNVNGIAGERDHGQG